MSIETIANAVAAKAKEQGLNIYSVAAARGADVSEVRVNPANQCNNSYSVAKSFAMTAIGLLYDRKEIRTGDKLCDILRDELPYGMDDRWRRVTVDHLLTHRAGFDRGFLDIDVDDISDDDYLRAVLSEPLAYEPGDHYQYTDAVFYLISRIVSKITGKRLDDFLRPLLFDVLRFKELAWSVCPHGYSIGATGLYLRTSDMVKLGLIYANGGRYLDSQILSPDWVSLVLDRGYTFTRYGDSSVYSKGGMYGQKLCFDIETHTACAWHGYETGGVQPLTDEFARLTE